MSCSHFPDCDGARTEEGKELEGPREIGKTCPKCGAESEKGLEKIAKEKERREKLEARKAKAEAAGKPVPE
jgi:ssDNA-binding Zn-finger/Zn-ribbon topoisomerase 1